MCLIVVLVWVCGFRWCLRLGCVFGVSFMWWFAGLSGGGLDVGFGFCGLVAW